MPGTTSIELVDGFAKDLNQTGFVVLTACNDNQLSYETPTLQNGIFTYYINEALSGYADVNSNGVSAEEAFAYAAQRTSDYVLTHDGSQQDPQLYDGIAGEVLLTTPTTPPPTTPPPTTQPPPSLGEALDNTALSWTTGGNANWFGQTCIYYYGGDSARSGAITHNQSTWLRTTVTEPGTLKFIWAVSSEYSYDYLRFYIDGIQQTSISGLVDGQQETYSIGSGVHTLEWRYTKDSSANDGLDCGIVDKVEYTPE
jgi:hypothetical protein